MFVFSSFRLDVSQRLAAAGRAADPADAESLQYASAIWWSMPASWLARMSSGGRSGRASR